MIDKLERGNSDMNDTNFIEAVNERDIDLVLLEELTVSQCFASWFAENIFEINGVYIKTIGVWHSITDSQLGESDLVFIFQNTEGEKYAVLIEDKIDAVAQPEQAKRYKKRGDKGKESKIWDSFKTCLVAPQHYIDSERDATQYDKRISYEQIRDWFIDKSNSIPDDMRYKYKARLMDEAIEQNRRGYMMIPNEKVSIFWRSYWGYAEKHYPKLKMKRPGQRPADSGWIYFTPDILNKSFRIVHKLGRSCVDLQIAGAAGHLDELSKKYQSIVTEDMEFVTANKSAAIRIGAPYIDRFKDFYEQQAAADSGLMAAEKLLETALLIQKDYPWDIDVSG